jgi:phage FluMu protein Com
METIQLQCGHCRKVMAISVEHLGGQVKCPHCQGVVQTPAPAGAPVPNMELNTHRESIFAGSEASDSVIGETAAPKVEMPPPSAQTEAEPEAELTKFKPRPVFTKSVFAMYALIFLIPYAILTTLAILYLVFNQTTRHPFDMIRDPIPDANKGGAKRAMMDPMTPLAPHQRVALGKQLRVGKDGDLLVTPERIVLTEEGDLRLFLRAKNISKDTAFEPCNELFVKHDARKNTPSYTFLQSKSKNLGNVFGAYLGYRNKVDDEDSGSAVLSPGQEIFVVLTTYHNPQMKEIAKGNDSQLWRIELRRGLVKYAGKDVSATTVIGVEFNSAEVGQEGKKS